MEVFRKQETETNEAALSESDKVLEMFNLQEYDFVLSNQFRHAILSSFYIF
jgi:hypothetical protein